MKKYLIIVGVLVLISSLFVLAQNVEFPVAELGNCESESECKAYCDVTENIKPCIDFAEKHSLMSTEEIAEARSIMPFLLAGTTPGGCKEEQECDIYCDKEENFNECVDFAVNAGFMDAEEAVMAKKTGGKGPGGCVKDECDAYCDKEENFVTCVDFAVEHDLMSAEEAVMAKKIGSDGGPGGCRGEQECDAYCDDNVKECFDFMMEHDLMSNEDKVRFENMGPGEMCMMNCMLDENLKPGQDCGPGTPNGPGCSVCAKQCIEFIELPKDLPEDQRCMAKCMVGKGLTPGQDCGPGTPNGPGCNVCAGQCFEEPAPPSPGEGPDMDDEHRCMAECMMDSGLQPGKDCGEGATEPECTECGSKCFKPREHSTSLNENTDLPEDQKCMAQCMVNNGLTPGQDCGEGATEPECTECGDKCFQKPQQPAQEIGQDVPEDQRCMGQCMLDAGLTPGVDSSGPEFDSCIDQCFEKPEEPETRPSETPSETEQPTENNEETTEEPESTPEETTEEPSDPPEETSKPDAEENKDEITGTVILEKTSSSFSLVEWFKNLLSL